MAVSNRKKPPSCIKPSVIELLLSEPTLGVPRPQPAFAEVQSVFGGLPASLPLYTAKESAISVMKVTTASQ
jgi:hypothetical protein